MLDLTQARRRRAKGRWMQLRDRGLLAAYIKDRRVPQAQLARNAQVSRQFINQLVSGRKRTCTPQVAERIEEGLGLLKGTLFVPGKSPSAQSSSSATQDRVAA